MSRTQQLLTDQSQVGLVISGLLEMRFEPEMLFTGDILICR